MPENITPPDKKAFLASVPLFQMLDDDQLGQLAEMTEVMDYMPGNYVCHEGELGESLFLILSGAVSLEKDGVELGTYRRHGDWVGEMTLLDQQPRSASLRAATDVRILQLARDQFELMLSEYPEAGRELFKVLSSRLRESLNIQIDAIRREAAFDQEIKLAAEVQQSLLPNKEMEFNGIKTAGYCKPASTVGGDYYDYLTLGADRIGIVITDVMGHGFHSAMFAAMVRSCLQTQIRHAASVNAVMNSIRQSIDTLDTSLYLSICYLLVNTTSRTFTFANAGHPFPLHYRLHYERLDKLESTCTPVGLWPGLPFPPRYVRRRQWDPGDVLLLYSDGVTEARNEAGEEFGEERLEACFLENIRSPVEEIKTSILDNLSTFCGNTAQVDDVTLIAVRL